MAGLRSIHFLAAAALVSLPAALGSRATIGAHVNTQAHSTSGAMSAEAAAQARRTQAFGAEVDGDCKQEPKIEDTSAEALRETQKHVTLAAKFEYQNIGRIVASAQGYQLAPLFDKSKKIAGDEKYEDLVRMQIDGLKEHDIRDIEDKIISKKSFEAIGVTPTKYFYAAHKTDYDSKKMRAAMEAAFATGVTSYIVKPSHMAWSKGLLVVRDRSKDLDYVDQHIRDEVLSKQDENEDSAHLKTLVPGVIIEALFGATPGQKPRIPLECKVQVVWGEVYLAHFVGQDQDGCILHNEAIKIFGDNSSWGITPERRWILDEGHWDKIVGYAKQVARHLKADLTRADFFLAPGHDDVELNEVESVSGSRHWGERKGLGEAWRLGYTANGNFLLTADKVSQSLERLHADREILEGPR